MVRRREGRVHRGSVQSIDNQTDGVAVGTFTATLQKSRSPDNVVTNGQFHLTLG